MGAEREEKRESWREHCEMAAYRRKECLVTPKAVRQTLLRSLVIEDPLHTGPL